MLKNELLTRAKEIPGRPGIYMYKNEEGLVLYVGKALSLKDRISSYAAVDVPTKTSEMLKNASSIDYIETGSDFEALLLEARLIKLHRPKYNVTFKDDKNYLYIFISLGEEYPKVFLTRKPKNFLFSHPGRRLKSRLIGSKDSIAPASSADGSLQNDKKPTYELLDDLKGTYFGPFPSSKMTRLILMWLRRVLPFCTQKRIGNRVCFYSHIGLCNPCPAYIVKQAKPERSLLTKKYRINIFRLSDILQGNIGKVCAQLSGQMQQFSKLEQFEEADKCKKMLTAFEYLLSNRPTTEVFLENPNFFIEKQQTAQEELNKILTENGLVIKKLTRIECFDISNFDGTDSVAAQVVFINGVAEKSQYRRYKIHIDGKPNDFAMLAEAVERRLKHTEWTFPDLFVIDGGKGQVSTVINKLKELEIAIPVIGLAKQFEKIILLKNAEFKEIRLPKRSNALQLMQQLRDEAHRFGLALHRKRRAKAAGY